MFEVREKDRERLAADLADDRISRLSLWVREARHFGLDRDTLFVVLAGYEGILDEAQERILGYGRVPEEAERILAWVAWEDDASALALGTVLGPADVVEAPPRPRTPLWKRFWRWLLE